MTLVHPIWFFALAAVSIPVAIHLWNIRKGKTLKIGSIALITEASQKRSLSRRLNDVLLLLLRCLFLILVVFTLAAPLLPPNSNSSKTKGWVLIPKESVKEAYQKFKPAIDSLTKAGFEFHYFNKDFARSELNNVLADTGHYQSLDASYWSLIQQLDSKALPSLPVYVFTSNGTSHFAGGKPEVALNLHWQTYTAADSIRRWIAKAWLTNSGDIEIVEGSSNPAGTTYKNYSIRSGDQSTDYAVHSDNGVLSVGLKNSNDRVRVDTSTWRFSIYADKNSPDAGYLKAALQSISQFSKFRAIIKQYTKESQIASQQDWLFWLSGRPANKQLHCKNLFIYENGKVNCCNSWINAGRSYQKIELYKSITPDDKGFAIWKDGFGNSVLDLEPQSGRNLYHFYSRFEPAWSDLVWDSEFPKMLMKLIVASAAEPDSKYDKRILSDRQIVPVITHKHAVSAQTIADHIDLSRYIWLLLALVFFAERWLSHHNKFKPVLKNG